MVFGERLGLDLDRSASALADWIEVLFWTKQTSSS